MSSRVSLSLIILFTLAVVGGVTYYFVREFRAATQREEILSDLQGIAREEGACAALAKIRAIDEVLDDNMQDALVSQRSRYVTEIVGTDDTKARAAFIAGDAEHLIDRSLCEQIRLVRELGEMHPVLALLRLTRAQGDVCDASFAIGDVLAGLSSHRTTMLKALLEDPTRLKCLPPNAMQQIANMAISWVREEPRALDDLDVLRVAGFLSTWTPVATAQLGCTLEAKGAESRLGNAIGCTGDHKNRVLVRYRYKQPLPNIEANSDVFLLGTRDDRCEVRPVAEPPRMFTVNCSDLTLASDVDVAVLMEPIVYGLVRADLIAGMAHYVGSSDSIQPAKTEPKLGSWFAYNRTGDAVGMTEVVTLNDLAERFGENLPSNPLRAFCRQGGARYCYDVDWAQVVSKLDGEPVIFLSRPLGVFVPHTNVQDDVQAQIFEEAFKRPLAPGAALRVYSLGKGGYLVAEVRPAAIEMRWRLKAEEPWSSQGFGTPEGGQTPPSARLLAVMDLQHDGKPELIVQRALRAKQNGEVHDVSDEIVLLGLDGKTSKFQSINQLTVREY
ncbi:MAG: hypothetical protein ACAI38_12400 [Myxococcota bacterium]